MLPIPFKDYIPKIFGDDSRATSLGVKIDTHLEAWKKDILDIQRLVRSDECPSWCLDELGFYLNAGLKNLDTELQKRQKILYAIYGHIVRGRWTADAKIRIDRITGYDSELTHIHDTDEWIMFGGAEISPEVDYYWGSLGTDGADDSLGLWLMTTGYELPIAGNVIIDAHQGVSTPVLTAGQIAQIVDEITSDIVPAYYRVYIGYYNGASEFVEYTHIG